MANPSDSLRLWPKPDSHSGLSGIQYHYETRWVECRELPRVHEDYDVELQDTSGDSDTRRLNNDYHHNEYDAHEKTSKAFIRPWKFLSICWKSSSRGSMMTNSLWPFTIAAIVLHYYFDEHQLWIFVTAYIGMVPAANLVGFSGHQLARKLNPTLGILVETAIGSCVELILLCVLIIQPGNMSIRVIRAVILGSILANLLLCLGLCFFVGGIFYPNQSFHVAISEVACNLMLVAGMGLIIPSVFYNSLSLSSTRSINYLDERALRLSRVVAVVLLAAFFAYLWFQTRSHSGIYQDLLQTEDTPDERRRNKHKAQLTLVESILAVMAGITFVSFMAVFLVQQIEVCLGSLFSLRFSALTSVQYIVIDRHLSEEFKGLILVPVVEKISEHLTAMHKAHQNQMNYALAQVLGSSIQTALLNTPLIVLIGWALDKNMSLNFEIFDAAMLLLAIIVVGSFLRDEKSDYLEGMLSVFVYLLIAVGAYYYPNPESGESGHREGAHSSDT